jgi:hypothetical protein
MDEKIKYPKGIYGDPSIPSQKLTRNKDYYGQIREDIDAHLEYLLELKSNPRLIMGIGFKDETRNRRIHHLDNSYVFPTKIKQKIEVNIVD